MAEKKTNRGNSACLMCLEQSDALKILPNCKHVFCCKCLADCLKKQSPGTTEMFSCPTCQTPYLQCLQEYDQDEASGNNEEEKKIPRHGERMDTPCRLCLLFKDRKVDAASRCEDCGYMHLCRDCTDVHRKKKATADHVLISLKKKGKGICRVHKELINCYCTSCSEPCCQFCVSLDHGDHNIKKIGEVFHSLVDEIKTLTGEQGRRSADLKRCEPQLRFLEGTEMIGRRDILIKETEDQVERCMDHIIHQKESTIQQIKHDHKAVTDVMQCLERVPTLGTLDAAVAKANKIVAKAEVHPEDIQSLSAVKNEILDCRINSDLDMEAFWENYKMIHDSPTSFTPNPVTNISIGTLQAQQRPSNLWNLQELKSVFEKAMTVDNQTMFIPSVSNLGNSFYAVAHPVLPGNKSDAVDIYKFPGELQRTFRDHVSPLYDMAATFFGQLAILSSGTAPDTCSVRFFDPEAGYVRTSSDLPVRNPLSFDINGRGQYAILNNDGGSKIHVVNDDGSVDLIHVYINDGFLSNPAKISCSGAHYYVSGGNHRFNIHKRQGETLALVVNSGETLSSDWIVQDISVTRFDRIKMCWSYGSQSYLDQVIWTNNKMSDRASSKGFVYKDGPNNQSRIAARDGCNCTVWSHANTIRVYEG